jgi:hypothetical protein
MVYITVELRAFLQKWSLIIIDLKAESLNRAGKLDSWRPHLDWIDPLLAI